MNKEVRTLILYRIERAREAIDEALILLEKGHANTFINRLYYACFLQFLLYYLLRGFLLLNIVAYEHSFIKIS